jgi:hypothetical protein
MKSALGQYITHKSTKILLILLCIMVVRCSDMDPVSADLCIAIRVISNYFQVNGWIIHQIRLRSLISTLFLIHFY